MGFRKPELAGTDARVVGGSGEGSQVRHVWMQVADDASHLPVALCGAKYDGRVVAPQANRALPVCELCKQLVDNHNRGARLGGRIEVQ